MDEAKARLVSLDDAERESCLEIKAWLEDDDIRHFRDQVQAEGRVFTVCEVKAMREYWNARTQRQAESERVAEIDAACREVYIDNLIQK